MQVLANGVNAYAYLGIVFSLNSPQHLQSELKL